MMTHKITLPDGTIIEIFTNADEVGQTDLDVQALWREAEQKAQRKMKLDEHIKHKSTRYRCLCKSFLWLCDSNLN